jgi:thioredoxin-like negative regulator of GroEL
VAEELGDKVVIYKLNTDDNQDLATQLQIHALPTLVFIGMDASKPALRTEGLLPAASIKDIIINELLASPGAAPAAAPEPAAPQQ